MKITKKQLKKIIKEELETTMDEGAWDSIKGALGFGGEDEAPAADPMANVPEEDREDFEEYLRGDQPYAYDWNQTGIRDQLEADGEAETYFGFQKYRSWKRHHHKSKMQDMGAQADIANAKRKRGSGGSSSSSSSYRRDKVDPWRATSAVGSSNLAYGESVEKIKDIIRETIQEMNRRSK